MCVCVCLCVCFVSFSPIVFYFTVISLCFLPSLPSIAVSILMIIFFLSHSLLTPFLPSVLISKAIKFPWDATISPSLLSLSPPWNPLTRPQTTHDLPRHSQSLFQALLPPFLIRTSLPHAAFLPVLLPTCFEYLHQHLLMRAARCLCLLLAVYSWW